MESDLTCLFNAPILAAFSYGSFFDPVIKPDNSSLIDYILIVQDTEEFHYMTKKQYPSHYSFLASKLSPKILSFINDSIPAGLYFHPYICVNKDKKSVSNNQFPKVRNYLFL